MKDLKSLHASVLPEAPMRIIAFADFERFRMVPRSSDIRKRQKWSSRDSGKEGKLLDMLNVNDVPGDMKLIFISHRWLRPDVDPAKAHPDDAQGSKHKLICAGVRKLAAKKEWDVKKVGLWLDFCGVEQDDDVLLKAGVASLRGYISICDAVLIPSPEVPQAGANTVDKIPGEYGGRAWTRLESMSFYTVSMPCLYAKQKIEMYAHLARVRWARVDEAREHVLLCSKHALFVCETKDRNVCTPCPSTLGARGRGSRACPFMQ